MTGVAVQKCGFISENATALADDGAQLSIEQSRNGVATTIAFMSGLIQVALWLLPLDRLAAIISPVMAEGFLTATAVMVIVSQLPAVFGSGAQTSKGLFGTPLVTVATAASHFLELDVKHSVKVVGHITSGFPKPTLPPFENWPSLLPDAAAIAIVQFVSTFSIAKLFGQKQRLKANASQEMLAYGMSNVVGSFFSCIPAGSALARSVVLREVGVNTQALWSLSFLSVVLLNATYGLLVGVLLAWFFLTRHPYLKALLPYWRKDRNTAFHPKSRHTNCSR
ncbi:hypothetical protein HPB52_009142 [Rhipicephalus sanguineus]|uniref:SLC26A/SulP transporter domain-containing protein n=1 Tax=Rhipicephalus sanguineus TaxID=34632 RepID=A0A9D4SNX4_RHISA|nr:hypothetical protein HPB52_009142 [Rhipicephalus sanguineus]